MKQIAIVMNTDRVGGAERSQILQFKAEANVQLTFFIPQVSGSKDLEYFILENLNAKIQYYQYPSSVYQLSRAKKGISLSFIIASLSLLVKADLNLSSFDIVYLNGNKAAFYYFLSHLFKKNKKIIWHLRDYFSESNLLKLVWNILILKYKKQIKFISNSISVANNLKSVFSSNIDYEVIYNPSGLIKNSQMKKKFETLGFVSMMAPWKGVHDVYFFAWFYESELKALGIKKIRLYGDNVYETKGDHSTYKNDLKKMIEKMPTDLIEFAGLKKPEAIYSEIDCLIHYSISPEPFGRVIVEAFANSVPVITTGLGGAGEIIENGVTGFKTILYDRQDLYEKIQMLKDENVREMITKNGLEKIICMEKEIDKKMQNILE